MKSRLQTDATSVPYSKSPKSWWTERSLESEQPSGSAGTLVFGCRYLSWRRKSQIAGSTSKITGVTWERVLKNRWVTTLCAESEKGRQQQIKLAVGEPKNREASHVSSGTRGIYYGRPLWWKNVLLELHNNTREPLSLRFGGDQDLWPAAVWSAGWR